MDRVKAWPSVSMRVTVSVTLPACLPLTVRGRTVKQGVRQALGLALYDAVVCRAGGGRREGTERRYLAHGDGMGGRRG